MKVSVDELKPTQVAVGFEQVNEKVDKLRRMDGSDLKEYLKGHEVPVIRGSGKLFMIDHHHLCLAAHRLGIRDVYVDVKEDLSMLSEYDFWRKMKEEEFIYMFDEVGAPIPFEEFPRHLAPHVAGLKNDPYRSLAGLARRHGGYDKVYIPYTEFLWATYFRKADLHVLPDALIIEKEVLKAALELCRSEGAAGLPGYKKAMRCIREIT